MSVSLIILIIFGANLLWAVLNWRAELDLAIAVWDNFGNVEFKWLVLAPLFLIGDILVTSSAVSLFGFSGFQGSAMAILLSNLLSVFFFTPKGPCRDMLKIYRQNQRDKKANA